MENFETVAIILVGSFTLLVVVIGFICWYIVNRKSDKIAFVEPDSVAALEATDQH